MDLICFKVSTLLPKFVLHSKILAMKISPKLNYFSSVFKYFSSTGLIAGDLKAFCWINKIWKKYAIWPVGFWLVRFFKFFFLNEASIYTVLNTYFRTVSWRTAIAYVAKIKTKVMVKSGSHFLPSIPWMSYISQSPVTTVNFH